MSKKSSFRDALEFAALILVLYFLIDFGLGYYFPDQFGDRAELNGVFLEMQDTTVKEGHHPIAVVRNKTEAPLTLPSRCPQPPIDILKLEEDEFALQVAENLALPCKTEEVEIAPGSSATVDLGPWKYEFFSEIGATHKARLSLPPDLELTEESVTSVQFSSHEAGWMTQVFRSFVSKPLLNLLIFIASVTPGHNLGLAVILLTLLVKIALYFPTKQGLESQKKLQAIQPKLEAIKQKYKDDPKKFQEETMKIWKEHKVNPVGSCLPMLIQFPVLIGLFFVIRDGAVIELSQHLIYDFYQDLPWTFGMNFLGLDLHDPNAFIMAPLLVVLQFVQMKLTFDNAEKKKAEKDGGKKKDDAPDPQAMQKTMMLYGLPLMIGVFAFQFPMAVSLYWLVSTVFAIGQQVVVNKGK